ncbi:Uncharacterised protein [Mycobacteroides abscessus subsp. abscessus]|nr:Uncharacterised protein [Mycobacteroides abscessus subsp. abscessus]
MPPKTEAASLVCRAANWPIVLIPNLFRRSSATGPIPHNLRTGSSSSSVRSSSGAMIRTPSGLANPEAILAICLPEPAPTDAVRPVSPSTRERNS